MVLKDHIRKGKKLLPPMIASGFDIHETSWHMQRLPEVFWLGLLIHRVGSERAFDLSYEMSHGIEVTIRRLRGKDNGVHAYRLSEHLGFTDGERRQIASDYQSASWLASLRPHIDDMSAVWPELPIKYLATRQTFDSGNVSLLVREIKALISQCTDRHDRLSKAEKVTSTICVEKE